MSDLGAQIPYLQIGLLMAIAVVGVYLAERFRQSLILAYILVGLLIGPNIAVLLPAGGYTGVVQDEGVIRTLLEIGLVFMFLFVGLEFSITRLRETRKASSFLAITHVSANLFLGFLLGTWLGWSLIDTLFLAIVVAASSAAVAMTSLRQLGLIRGKEVRFILGSMVVEDFMLIVLFALASGWATVGALSAGDVLRLSMGVVFLYAFFIILGFWIVPRAYAALSKVRNGDMFILLALALVFLAGAFALLLGEYPAFGTFFMGLALAETPFGRRLARDLEALRNGFTAIFFISFGMLIQVTPDVLSSLVPMLLLVVPLIIVNEVLLVGGIGYLLGFRSQSAVTIGASLCGRGEDSLLYASVGEGLVRNGQGTQAGAAAHGAILFSFAGAFSFLMTALAMPLIKHSYRFVHAVTSVLPASMHFAGVIIHATFHQSFFENRKVDRTLVRTERYLFVAGTGYLVVTLALLVTAGLTHLLLLGIGMLAFALLYLQMRNYVRSVFSQERLAELNLRIPDYRRLQTLVARVVCGLLGHFLAVAALYQFLGLWTVLIPVAVVVALAVEVEDAHRCTMRHLGPLPRHHQALPTPKLHAPLRTARTPTQQLPKGGRGSRAGIPGANPHSAPNRALRGEDSRASVPAWAEGSSATARGRDCIPAAGTAGRTPGVVPLAARGPARAPPKRVRLGRGSNQPTKGGVRPRGVETPRSMRGLPKAARPRTLRGRGWGAAAHFVTVNLPHPPSMAVVQPSGADPSEGSVTARPARMPPPIGFDHLGNRER